MPIGSESLNPMVTELSQQQTNPAVNKPRPSNSGGLDVSMDQENLQFRHIAAGATDKTSVHLSAEPKRAGGLHGPATGPGLLSNHVVTSMVSRRRGGGAANMHK